MQKSKINPSINSGLTLSEVEWVKNQNDPFDITQDHPERSRMDDNVKFKKKIYLIGNPLVKEDSLPIRLKPDLKRAFPKVEFVEIDPNEEFFPEDNSIIVDTVKGIDKVTWFDSVNDFSKSPRISPHDYDLGWHLRLLTKLGKLGKLGILGIPVQLSTKEAQKQITRCLNII